jgi:hypothetical protein
MWYSRKSSNLIIDNSYPDELKLEDNDVINRLMRYPATKMGLDDLYISLAETHEITETTDRSEPIK